VAERTEEKKSWLTYAAARSARLFGTWKVVPALVGVTLGMLSPFGSSGGEGHDWVAPTFFTAVAALQVGSSVLLFHLHNSAARNALSVYYAIATFFCLGVTVGAAFRPVIGPFLGGMMSIGLAAMAFTAFYLLTNWQTLAQARTDGAVFLGSTHVLALVAVAAAAVRALFPDSGEWVDALAQTTFLSLTALALPLVAGLWVRLSVHAHAEKRLPETDAVQALNPSEKDQCPEVVERSTEVQDLRHDASLANAAPAVGSAMAAGVIVVVTPDPSSDDQTSGVELHDPRQAGSPTSAAPVTGSVLAAAVAAAAAAALFTMTMLAVLTHRRL
jgi:hypothetical protein